MTQIFLTFLIFIFGTATPLIADEADKKEEKKIPIRITSDKMKYHENGFIVFFTGNVNVDDGEMKLNCDFMTVNLDKTRNPVKIICEKNVVIRKQNSTSHSDRAEYYVPEEKVTLTGSPKVVSVNTKGEKQTFTGKKIDFFRSNNEIVTYGGTVEFGAPPKKTEEKEKK
ncbi:MAG: LPS export ABC transporter periplasmic protein LptC [Lentisphaerales bacterium]|nr:LPS export ABC transporter periplasmic protein LptC [Lentisphaerales bacterium]